LALAERLCGGKWEEKMAFKLISPVFNEGKRIPDEHARDGHNVSPPLEWTGAPAGARSFVLAVEDSDAAGSSVWHWAVYDIPGDRIMLHEGEDLTAYGLGVNDFGNRGYDGPQPAGEHRGHHYHFRLAALATDHLEGLDDAPSAAAVWDRAQKSALAEAELVGTGSPSFRP
jgi:Raf kinase inhibitor-like YbhB/YbcL family protein